MPRTKNAANPKASSVSGDDVRLARTSSRELAALNRHLKGSQVPVTIPLRSGKTGTVVLPTSALRLLQQVLSTMAEGKDVACVPVDAELTTQQAANLLNVSRPFLIGLLERDAIAFRKVGAHRRIRLQDLLAYKSRTDRARARTLEKLAADAQELDMGY